LQQAEVMLLSSVSETFGLVILEAWAAGTPVIATDASGPSALVRHGENGWLFSLSHPETFHWALDRTLDDPAHARQMAERGRRVTEEHSVDALAARLHLLYEQLVEEKLCAT
jgi:glycosyltransferase involved in cell wall biosynthesis